MGHSSREITERELQLSAGLVKSSNGGEKMITIAKDHDMVTLINAFSCEPQNQQSLIDSSIRATEAEQGKLPGIISAALHRSKDGMRVVNYAQWRRARN
jgi:hypothetical protein